MALSPRSGVTFLRERAMPAIVTAAVVVSAVTVGYVLARPSRDAAAINQARAQASSLREIPGPAAVTATAPAGGSASLASRAHVAPDASATSVGSAASDSLRDTMQPLLPLDRQGRLLRTREVRDFFDYFLTARNERSTQKLDADVRQTIDAQLGDMPAHAEALAVWERYQVYRAALAQAEPSAIASGSRQSGPPAVQTSLEARARIAARVLGEWSTPFFGDELERSRYRIERMRIEQDQSLSDAEKAARLRSLEDTRSPEQRREALREQQQAASLDMLTKLTAQTSPDDNAPVRQIAQQFGEETARRFTQMRAAEGDWNSRYADYARERDMLRAQYADPVERRVRVEALRGRYFPAGSDASRAASLDDGDR
ncbi:lipase secretion chaperone [Burkholderia sp. WSM2232]|uniref:lipase secretion chaperone n=1 Tax=Burkholderia sp. WSM2232 TaxID=944436 RepID=UPI001E448A2F|nr:lipase secretion chaperone [Burkholderia sp. WSM2232]